MERGVTAVKNVVFMRYAESAFQKSSGNALLVGLCSKYLSHLRRGDVVASEIFYRMHMGV